MSTKGINKLVTCELQSRSSASTSFAQDCKATVAVVVTSHNYGRFLRQCLDSLLAQDRPANAIVLVDDASTDETPVIGREYIAHGIRYERVAYQDVAKSRNHGAAVAGKPTFLLNVDGDNWLPPNYLAALLKQMQYGNVGVAYCPLRQVDELNNEIGRSKSVRSFSLDSLRKQNIADTCSLVRRQAIEQVGGWRANQWGLQDWDLWLRIANAGWKFRYTDATALNYRVHDHSMSHARKHRYECGMEIMRDVQLTTIVSLFCGRHWNLDRWFESLNALKWNRKQLHLIAVDNSRDAQFHDDLNRRLETFDTTTTLVRDDSQIIDSVAASEFSDAVDLRTLHKYAFNQHLARLYALATRYLPASTSNVLSIEDDVCLPSDALEKLATELFRLQDAAAVSGCLWSRFVNRLIAWTNPGNPVDGVPRASIRIVATGFFCMLVRRAAWDNIAWRPGATEFDRHPYYDWAACRDLQQSGSIYLTPVRCEHWQADGTCLHADGSTTTEAIAQRSGLRRNLVS